ncbi:uncharacterized protein [Periplaneta americana]|uniref:uncharacterized protein n=1 Tax=Periplaneta americana TaxID=6978 RepID=UPI0037E91F28
MEILKLAFLGTLIVSVRATPQHLDYAAVYTKPDLSSYSAAYAKPDLSAYSVSYAKPDVSSYSSAYEKPDVTYTAEYAKPDVSSYGSVYAKPDLSAYTPSYTKPSHLSYAPTYAKPVDYYAHPRYQFNYGVKDQHTGDLKSQWEHRDGDKVKGSYSVLEPDGSVRTVDYTADDHNGFNAVVKKSGPSRHPSSKHITPIHQVSEAVVSIPKPITPIVSIPKPVSVPKPIYPVKSSAYPQLSYSQGLELLRTGKQYYAPDLGGLSAYSNPGGLAAYNTQSQPIRTRGKTQVANPGPVLFPETPEEPEGDATNQRRQIQEPVNYYQNQDETQELTSLYHEYFGSQSQHVGRA